jgi:hypothetical protein
MKDEWVECPFHQGPILDPCTLIQCDLWLEDQPAHCLFLAYKQFLRDEGSSDLDWEQLGRLLGLSSECAESLATEAYEFLRIQHVKDNVSAQWSLLHTDARCVVCGRQAIIQERGWGWCSDACYCWLPPSAAEVEAQWGIWFREILGFWKKISPKLLEKVMGLNREIIRWMLWQHVGYDPEVQNAKKWVKRRQPPFLPNPKIPKVDELTERINQSENWGNA